MKESSQSKDLDLNSLAEIVLQEIDKQSPNSGIMIVTILHNLKTDSELLAWVRSGDLVSAAKRIISVTNATL